MSQLNFQIDRSLCKASQIITSTLLDLFRVHISSVSYVINLTMSVALNEIELGHEPTDPTDDPSWIRLAF